MTDCTELKRLAENHLSLGQAYTVAKPSVLLALIAENERLKVDLKSVVRLNNENADLFKTKNDKLKAENERLESEAVYSAAGFDAAREEISKLRAEVAGLKTGYEAYERVNAELKAENETLVAAAKALRDEWRKDQADAKRHRFARDCAYGALTLMEGKRVFVELDYPEGEFSGCDQAYDTAIDAALGQGEQS